MLGETEVVALVQGLSRRRLRQWVQAGWVLPAQGEGVRASVKSMSPGPASSCTCNGS